MNNIAICIRKKKKQVKKKKKKIRPRVGLNHQPFG